MCVYAKFPKKDKIQQPFILLIMKGKRKSWKYTPHFGIYTCTNIMLNGKLPARKL